MRYSTDSDEAINLNIVIQPKIVYTYDQQKSQTRDAMKVLINCVLKINPEQRDQALIGAASLIDLARQEPGCLAYNWGADLMLNDTIHIYEEWESEDALAAHFSAPSFDEMSAHLSKHGLMGASAKKFLVSKEAGIYDANGKANAYFT